MAQPPIFEDIDHLTDEFIDDVNAKLQLQTLRDLCLAYNNNHDVDTIEIEEIQDDKIAMIIALWMRGQYNIHESITWGDPYDKGLKESIRIIGAESRELREEVDENGDVIELEILPKAKENAAYHLFTHTDQLLGYIIASFQAKRNEVYYERRLKGELLDQTVLKPPNRIFETLGIPQVKTMEELYATLRMLKPIALIYLLLVGTVTAQSGKIFRRPPNLYGYLAIYYPVG